MRSTLGEGAAGAVAAAAAREASWTANSLIATVEQRQRWASFSEGMCAELFAALTVLCVHSSEWRKKKTRRCVEFSSKFRAIFCCCSLVEMKRLWTYVARKVRVFQPPHCPEQVKATTFVCSIPENGGG